MMEHRWCTVLRNLAHEYLSPQDRQRLKDTLSQYRRCRDLVYLGQRLHELLEHNCNDPQQTQMFIYVLANMLPSRLRESFLELVLTNQFVQPSVMTLSSDKSKPIPGLSFAWSDCLSAPDLYNKHKHLAFADTPRSVSADLLDEDLLRPSRSSSAAVVKAANHHQRQQQSSRVTCLSIPALNTLPEEHSDDYSMGVIGAVSDGHITQLTAKQMSQQRAEVVMMRIMSCSAVPGSAGMKGDPNAMDVVVKYTQNLASDQLGKEQLASVLVSSFDDSRHYPIVSSVAIVNAPSKTLKHLPIFYNYEKGTQTEDWLFNCRATQTEEDWVVLRDSGTQI